MDLQQPHVYECEEGRPIKRETKNGFIPPNYQGDDRGDKSGDYDFSQVCFLGSRASSALINYRTRETFGVDPLGGMKDYAPAERLSSSEWLPLFGW
jgi:hypothetical protein